MIQAIVKKGKVKGEKVPAPVVSKGRLLIKVVNSCISAGTEISKVERTGKSLIKMALDQPAEVKQVINMLKERGISKTISKVRGALDTGKQSGYSISGIVIDIGEGVKGFEIGDKVAAAGADLANHAEYVSIPENLVMKIPDHLDFKKASTVTLGGIALQGVRRAELNIGEYAVVVGVGILGLLTVQMLRLSGIRVAAADLDESRLELAKIYGAELIINTAKQNLVKEIENWTNSYGSDAVIFTAATKSSEALSQSFKICKKKGRVILVGVSGMDIKRADIYEKELDFKISTSYGPGRYDKGYEEKGHDYPYAYVRWTEKRNMSEYLRLLANNEIKLDKMINKIFPIENVEEAFEALNGPEKPILTILDYGDFEISDLQKYRNHERKVVINIKPVSENIIKIALVGAGSFAAGTHLPNLQKLKDKYELYAVVNRSGHKAKAVAEQFGAQIATSNIDEVLNDKNVDMVLISTRHESHAALTLKALQNGKHVFVEKPLATRLDDLKAIEDFYSQSKDEKPILMVGFNRRFSRYAVEIKKHADKRMNPLIIHYRMNAGYLPKDHWVHEHGGRIVGEACHIVDLMTYLTQSEIESIFAEQLTPQTEKFQSSDNKIIVLKYKDGSIATIEYLAVGSKKLSKEYMEIHFDEKSIIMDDYKSLKGYDINIKEINTRISEKGQFEELVHLYDSLSGKNKSWPIDLWDILQTTEVTLSI
ncbi:MAG: bi-domain-containing oxidoreductase [Calditrichaceae bacterium]|nr:bi-domain-containing oxidoreductase [Calditrichaceae bacterium]